MPTIRQTLKFSLLIKSFTCHAKQEEKTRRKFVKADIQLYNYSNILDLRNVYCVQQAISKACYEYSIIILRCIGIP